MKSKLSVVIVCKNEAHIIARTINSVRAIADEVVVYDTGSTDDTVLIARELEARVIAAEWEGYGRSKQRAVAAASNDWILSLDADEVPDSRLQHSIAALNLNDAAKVYAFRYRNFLGDIILKWGEFGFNRHVRLFNRQRVNWNTSSVHEGLVIPADIQKETLQGFILHYTMKDTRDYVNKSVHYAMLNAEQYYRMGRKGSWVKQYVAPAFTFFKHYIFRLGFLDGWAGLFSARMAALYAYLKYARLHELWKSGDKK